MKMIRVRGFASTNDASTPAALSMVRDGTGEAVTLGPSDILYLESYQFASGSGITTLFFSDDGVNETPSRRVAQALGALGQRLAQPIKGAPGERLYVGSSGANRVDATFVGLVYQS